MQRKLKNILAALTPPIAWEGVRRILSGVRGRQIRFAGDFKSWADAEACSTGYGAQDILERTIEAARKVSSDEAAFARDGVAFGEMEHNFPLAWALMHAATRYGRLHVLDFGGALGSTYFQSRALIHAASDVRWAIVEQPAYVAAGTKEFGNRALSFHATIDAARRQGDFDVLLLSSVIQYLPDPLGFLDSVLAREFPTVILDRTPFMVDDRMRLTVQRVPDWIYPASYPAWLFSEAELVARFAQQYELIVGWPGSDNVQPEKGKAIFKGFIFERKKTGGA